MSDRSGATATPDDTATSDHTVTSAGSANDTDTANDSSVGCRPQGWRHPGFWGRPVTLLALVAVIHGLLPLILLGPNWGFGIDETVYLSQLNSHVPPGFFSAPRARGTTLVAAPVTLLFDSVWSVRLWLAAVTAVGVFLSFRPWLRLWPGRTVALAAALFCSIWSVAYYGFEAMPNEWVAFAVLAATGYALLYLRDGVRRHLVVIAAVMGVAALFRPSDAAFAAVGIVAGCSIFDAPGRRRLAVAAAVMAGLVLGLAQWVIEAHTSFGGVRDRIHTAQLEQGGSGLRFSGWAQVRALGGPLLCRTGCDAHADVWFWLWWLAAVALIGFALVLARRCLRREPFVVAVLVGVVTAAQYILTVDYAAPRFLVPTYALLSLPCAYGLMELHRRFDGRVKAAVTGALVVALAGHVLVQGDILVNRIKPLEAASTVIVRADAARLRALGVHGPCIVLGQPARNQVLAYAAGCSNIPNRAIDVRRLNASGTDVVWLGPNRPPAVYSLKWVQTSLPQPFGDTEIVYLALQPHADGAEDVRHR